MPEHLFKWHWDLILPTWIGLTEGPAGCMQCSQLRLHPARKRSIFVQSYFPTHPVLVSVPLSFT